MSDNVERAAVETLHAALTEAGTIDINPLDREDAERGRFYFVANGAMFSGQVEWIGDVPSKPAAAGGEPAVARRVFPVDPAMWRKLERYAAEHDLPGPQEAFRAVVRRALEDYVAQG